MCEWVQLRGRHPLGKENEWVGQLPPECKTRKLFCSTGGSFTSLRPTSPSVLLSSDTSKYYLQVCAARVLRHLGALLYGFNQSQSPISCNPFRGHSH